MSTRVLETGKEENCPVCKTSFKIKTWQEPKQEINLQVTTKPTAKVCSAIFSSYDYLE